METISRLLRDVASQLGVDECNIFSYGSSGGGYAALRLGAFMPLIGLVAVNPQIDITKYEFRNVEKFLKECFGGLSRESALQQHPQKMSIASHAEALQGRRIIYVQNELDLHHLNVHKPIFMDALTALGPDATRSLVHIAFEHEGGHAKAESSEAFTEAMKTIIAY